MNVKLYILFYHVLHVEDFV